MGCDAGDNKYNDIEPDDAYYDGGKICCLRTSPKKNDEKGMHSDGLKSTLKSLNPKYVRTYMDTYQCRHSNAVFTKLLHHAYDLLGAKCLRPALKQPCAVQEGPHLTLPCATHLILRIPPNACNKSDMKRDSYGHA